MLVDVHCHLHFPEFDNDRDEVIKRCKAANITAVITSGTDHANNVKALELAKKYDIVKASIGIYPDDVVRMSEADIAKELEFIASNSNNIVAIGEIGLDYKESTSQERQEKQKKHFKELLVLAEKLGKPVVLHTRKAEAEVVAIMESTKIKNAVFHCFTGSHKLVKKIADKGWYFSIPPIIVRSLHFQGMVNIVPKTQLLTETDSPYLAPPPKQRNEPIFIKETIEKIADLKNMNEEEVAKNIFANYQKIFSKK